MNRAEFRIAFHDARLVRGFELTFNLGVSSIGHAADHAAYCAAIVSGDSLQFSRRNGHYGVGGRTLRFVSGPKRRLPA